MRKCSRGAFRRQFTAFGRRAAIVGTVIAVSSSWLMYWGATSYIPGLVSIAWVPWSLSALIAVPAAPDGWRADELAAHRQTFQAALRPAGPTFTAHAAIDAVRHALPRDGVLSFDVGAHTHQIANLMSDVELNGFLEEIRTRVDRTLAQLPAACRQVLAAPDARP